MLGAKISIEHGIVNAYAENLVGTTIYMNASVGATINIMFAAVRAKGLTIIENAAKEPHIVDVANFLNAMGADIKGAGTDVIKIKGVDELFGGTYAIIPDQIEAGTFMVAAGAIGGRVIIRNVITKHLESISAKLEEAGVDIVEEDDFIVVSREGPLSKVNVKTLPYPGFPTDMQPQMTTLLCLAEGTSIVTETIFEHRFKYVDELRRMGAKIEVDGKVCVVEGIDKFTGASVQACDLRAGVALVIAGLAADGITEINGIEHVERGYENIVEKFKALGGNIKRISDTDEKLSVVDKIS
jgi:UDP-N-acetylglucosamine 1-carboxyvinyltransferase